MVQPQLVRRDAQIAEANRIAAEKKAAEDATRAAQEALERAKPLAPTITAPVGGGTLDSRIMALKICESGNNYATNTGNGYYGAYQYDVGTWANFGGYHLPSQAPPEVQDAKFQQTYAARGGSPWPQCSRRAGL